MNKVNELVLCRDNYDSQEDFEEAIKNAIMLLLDANYISVVRYDDKSFGIVVIEYNYAELEYGDKYPYWLYPNEEESVVYSKEQVR